MEEQEPEFIIFNREEIEFLKKIIMKRTEKLLDELIYYNEIAEHDDIQSNVLVRQEHELLLMIGMFSTGMKPC